MGNFGKTPFIHQILLCLVLLFQTGLGDTDLILNGKFLENSCQSITQDYSGCQSEDALNNWSGKFISNGSVAPISVQNTTRFQTFPTTTTGITNVVPLDTQNGNYIRTCIYQSLSTQMDPGAYTLRWAAATRNNILDPEIFSQFHYQVGILNSDETPGAVSRISISWTAFGSHQRQWHFELTSIKTDQVVQLCSKSNLGSDEFASTEGRGTGIGQVELIKYEDYDPEALKPLNQNLIRNGDFILNNCLGTETDDFDCQGDDLQLFWQSSFISNKLSSAIAVRKTGGFSNIPGSTDATRIVPLDLIASDSKYERICIKQFLGTLSSGLYTLQFDSATNIGANQNQEWYKNYNFTVYMNNSDNTQKAMNDSNFYFPSYSYQKRMITFQLKVRKTGQYIYFCSNKFSSGSTRTDHPRGAGLTNIELINAGCPTDTHKSIPMNTGFIGCINNGQFTTANTPEVCQIFKYNETKNSTSCATSCVFNSKMKIDPPGQNGYVCPTSQDAPYYDANCKEYDDKGQQSYVCNSCSLPYFLKTVVIGNKFYRRCLSSEIAGCAVYNIDNTCAQIVSNCQQALFFVQETVICLACKLNFILDQNSGCQPHVQHCERYLRPGVCGNCVAGYFLSNNVCYRVRGSCDMFDERLQICTKCAQGNQLINGNCVSIITCKDGQYRDLNGNCLVGKDMNCRRYDASNGDCLNCKEGFEFNVNLICVPQQRVQCSPNTEDQIYVVEFGRCKKIQQPCVYVVGDRCGACKDEYFLLDGICRKIPDYQGLTIENEGGLNV